MRNAGTVVAGARRPALTTCESDDGHEPSACHNLVPPAPALREPSVPFVPACGALVSADAVEMVGRAADPMSRLGAVIITAAWVANTAAKATSVASNAFGRDEYKLSAIIVSASPTNRHDRMLVTPAMT
jgi:hypothetical protein